MTIKDVEEDLNGSDDELSVAGESDCEGENARDLFDSSQLPVAEERPETPDSPKKSKPKKKKKKYETFLNINSCLGHIL